MRCEYAHDICIVDDTSCTNFYGRLLLVMMSEDENGNNQVLAFTIMENRCKLTFIEFFNNLRFFAGPIRVFVTDRNFTQISALEEVFPKSNIIYCTRHISKNVETSVNKDIKDEFIKMLNHIITEEVLIDKFNKYIEDHPDTAASKFLISLLEC